MTALLPRDFIETPEGLIFAVVDPLPEDGKALCWLRYLRDAASGRAEKLGTAAAIERLQASYPHFLHRSPRLDALVHGVPLARIARHYSAAERCAALLGGQARDAIEIRLRRLLDGFVGRGAPAQDLGVTGSLLIGAQTPASDFDLVAYSRPVFEGLRRDVVAGIVSGIFADLDESAWREAWARRGCPLDFDEYVWHERRKANKALFEGTKFDLSLVSRQVTRDAGAARKLGFRTLRGVVADDSEAFDYPARYRLADAEVGEILVFTQTYVGQAVRGDTIEAAGSLEQHPAGLRLVIGASREAPGEYLRVLHAAG